MFIIKRHHQVTGALDSSIQGPVKRHEQDPELIIPLFDKLTPFLPESWRQVLRCGYKYNALDKKLKVTFRPVPTSHHADDENEQTTSEP